MKKLLVFLAFLGLIVACQKAPKTLSYETVDTLYQSLPSVGFESNRYQIANYAGTEIQSLPFSKKPLSLFQETSEESKTDSFRTKSYEKLYPKFQSFCFLSDFTEINLFNLYFNGKPFTRAYTENSEPGKAHLWLKAVDLGKNSFLIKGKPYDFHTEQTGVFMNGKIIFDYLPVDGDIPLAAHDLKVWDKKIIFRIGQEFSGGKEAYLIFTPKTKELVCTDIHEISSLVENQ